jgi:hypothetical protein
VLRSDRVLLSMASEAALFEFIQTTDLGDAYGILANHPALLSDLALDKARQVITDQTDERAARRIAERVWLLNRCRQLGIDRVFRALRADRLRPADDAFTRGKSHDA